MTVRYLPTSLWLLAVASFVTACSVRLEDPAGRACDDAHPCSGGRVCGPQGVCVAPAGGGPDGGGGGDGGTPVACDEEAVGTACTVGQGACEAQGTWACEGGFQVCSATEGTPSQEVCDGADNDCDGETDEPADLLPPACPLTQGVCAGAAPACDGESGWAACDYGPAFETTEISCDGVDNDCDGTFDDVTGCLATLAGSGPPGFVDGVGPEARLARPQLIEVGPDGALYVPEAVNHAVRRVDLATGEVTTVVGTGRCGGADGPVATAELCDPVDVGFDAQGRMYISEWGGNQLRRLENGVLSTVAGTGWGSADGDGLSEAKFRQLAGLFVLPNGDVLLADYGNDRIRRYDGVTGQVTTEAGTTSGNAEGTRATVQLDEPFDVVADSAGVLYVSELSGDRIRELPVSGTSSILAGSTTGDDGYVEGVGTAARFADPRQLLLDEAAGVLYVADCDNYRVRAVPLDGTTTYPVAGGSDWGNESGPAAEAKFKLLFGVAKVGDTLYLSDYDNDSVRKVQVTSSFPATVVEDFVGAEAGRVRDGPADQALLEYPDGLNVLDDGRILWGEWNSNLLRELSADGTTVTSLVGNVTMPEADYVNGDLSVARFDDLHDLVEGPDGRFYTAEGSIAGIRVVDFQSQQVSTFAGPVGFYSSGQTDGSLSQARFEHPVGLAFGMDNGQAFLFVADEGNDIVRRIDFPNGPVVTLAGLADTSGQVDGTGSAARFDRVEAIEADLQGNAYVGDGNALRRVTSGGVVTTLEWDVGFSIQDVAWEAPGTLILVGGRRIARYDLGTSNLSTVLNAGYGFKDGIGQEAEALGFKSVVVRPEAYYLIDEAAGRIRRLWR